MSRDAWESSEKSKRPVGLLIAGTNSGCGKTTITCALLSALKNRGITPTAFKCGSDYIDPMFHRAITGINAYNLDPFFLDGKGLRSHLAAHAGQFSVIEGAMGYYDGIAATDKASAYTVARQTEIPVILVVSAKGVGYSLAATIEGYIRHRKDSRIVGVIFNDANESRYPDLEYIAKSAGVQAYGIIPHNKNWELPSRHLGLLTAVEIDDLQNKLYSLGRQAEQTIDIDGIISLSGMSGQAGIITYLDRSRERQGQYATNVRLAVARDTAFCFHYEENLELLRTLGCELIFFSPLRDSSLPANINGLYLCGGYPELHKEVLSGNKPMLESIKKAVKNGLPTIAESGGFMYLHETIDGLPMCGVIRGAAFKANKLQRFGYITLIAKRDNLLCKAGECIRSREFHYWDSDCLGDGFTARKAGRDISYSCIHATSTLYAGFPHMYFPANPAFAENFVEKMKSTIMTLRQSEI